MALKGCTLKMFYVNFYVFHVAIQENTMKQIDDTTGSGVNIGQGLVELCYNIGGNTVFIALNAAQSKSQHNGLLIKSGELSTSNDVAILSIAKLLCAPSDSQKSPQNWFYGLLSF